MAPRTLIIGLDGATFDLIDPLVQAGFLPNIDRLLKDGVRGPLNSWPNMNSAAAWSSMITGYNSGQHSIYDFGNRLARRGPGWHPSIGADRKKDPFWRTLSAAGQRVGVVNVPLTFPADQVTEFMLAGMDTPTLHTQGFAHPPELYTELHHQGIDYVIDIQNLYSLSQRSPHHLPGQVRDMVEARSRTILHLMQSQPWDVFMAVFTATDRVQHYYWPNKGTEVDSPDWAPIRTLYRQIDKFLEDALTLGGEETTVLMVSDHGFRSTYSATRCLNPLLADLGLLVYRQRGTSVKARLLKTLLGLGRRILPYTLQTSLAIAFPNLHLDALTAASYPAVDWSRTKVFASPQMGRIYINLQGRQPNGTVSPKDYASLRDRVQDILTNLMDPRTGARVVQAVHRAEEIYHGPYLGEAPDLAIEWNYDVLGDSLSYLDGGKLLNPLPPKETGSGIQYRGVHHPEGIFVAAGPYIKRAQRLTDARIYDVAPTVLHLQGQTILEDMDGRVLTDIFTEEYLRDHPVRLGAPAGEIAPADSSPLDEQGEAIIEERLRDLGYIE